MSKMSELSLVLDELITCGENMIKAAKKSFLLLQKKSILLRQ